MIKVMLFKFKTNCDNSDLTTDIELLRISQSRGRTL